jgi:hypothetical protein
MALNFNVDPYYDDFDPSKNFHRILFKPGYAIQARELTQSQTILQSQISKFADNIFSQNTPVTGGKVTTNLNCYFIKLNTQFANIDITASNFLNKVIQDSTGTILARVIKTVETTTVGTVTGDPPTLIVSYLSGVKFSDAQTIFCADGTNFTATTIGIANGTTCTGFSSVASISDGVFYIVNGYSQSTTPNDDGSFTKYSIGNFVSVQPQTTILEKYDNTPSGRVGLQITETIYDYINDSSLLDPAIGASNYQSPGADRYVIELELITLPLDLGNDDGFIELLRVEDGDILKQTDGTVYSVIDDYFAKRDWETNGDYIVNDFRLTPNTESSGDSTKYNLGVGPGIAYVHGYRIENQSRVLLTGNRARTTQAINDNNIFIDYGNYFYVDTVGGLFDVTTMPIIDLHSVPASNIVSTNTTTYTSTLVGTGYIRNLIFSSFATNSNTKSYIYKSYVNDLKTNSLSGTSNVSGNTTTTIAFYDVTGKFSSKANAYYGATISIISGASVGDARKIVSYNGTTKVATVDQPFTVTPDNTTNFSIAFSTTDVESIVQVDGSYALTANANINVSNGKDSGIDTGDTIYQSAGGSEMIFGLGNPFAATLTNTDYFSTRVYRGKSFNGSSVLTVASGSVASNIRWVATGTLGPDSIKQNFTIIDQATKNILDFSSSGNTVVANATSVTFTGNTTSGLYASKVVDIIAQVYIASGDDPTFILKSKNLVVGNTTHALAQSTGTTVNTNWKILPAFGQVYILNAGISNPPNSISLYVSDVKKIKKIIDTKASGTTVTDAMLSDSTFDVTNFFSFDNGQRDNLYDHSSIKLLPGAPKPQGNLLVIFDYYSHTAGSSGDGYFSVRSYLSSADGGIATSPETYAEIGSYSTTQGTTYRLADSVDFRPVRVTGSTTYTWEYTVSPVSPSDTGTLIPNNLSSFQGDYSYFLGRKDKLVLTKDKEFLIVEGTPSTNPQYPTEPDAALVLANMTLDPYTAYVPGENPPTKKSNLSINKVTHKRWAKKDITDLEDRISNLEYYTSLSLLETNAQSLQIPDSNGLNRFKNGILVDDFSSYSTADTSNPDYSSNINIRKNQLSPLSFVDNFQLQNPSVLASLGTLANTNTFAISSISGTQTNIFTLPYTTANVIVQPLASSTISVNPFNVVIQEGVAQLNPPMDNWVDNTQAPAILVSDPALQVFQQTGGVNYTNMGDWHAIPGTSITATGPTVFTENHRQNTPGGPWTEDWGFGPGVGQAESVTNTYASQLQNITSSGYASVPPGSAINNGFLTNVSILPYIRPQQVVVKAKGLLVNSPVSTFFDGKNVDQHMIAPNIIELTNVNATNGGFKENDIVGFYLSSTADFYPVARVISVLNSPNFGQAGTANTSRLYVSKITGANSTYGTTKLENATFNSEGVYLSSGNTAQGTLVNASNIISTHQSGRVAGVGGGYSNVLAAGATTQFYGAPDVGNYSEFLNHYGIWGSRTSTTTYNAGFTVVFQSPDTYTITVACSGTATVFSNGVSIATSSSTSPTTTTYTSNTNSQVLSWSATSSGTTQSAFALRITNSSGATAFDTSNPVYYSTFTIPSGVQSQIIMPQGGAWFTGVTQLKLAPDSSSNTELYVGSTINITSKYVYENFVAATYIPLSVPSGGAGGSPDPTNSNVTASSIFNYSRTITSADSTTGTVTLDSPVNISLGFNNLVGPVTSFYSINGLVANLKLAGQTGGTAKLSTDEKGIFVGIFNIPPTIFQTGSRVFRIDNRAVATDPNSATTYAEATFTASGLSTVSQQLNFSPSVDSAAGTFTQVSQRDGALIGISTERNPWDPVAQTFIIDEGKYPNGVFLKSIKLFFNKKPTTNIPVNLSIVGTLNGYPNGKIVPYSVKVLYPEQVTVSSNPQYLDPNSFTRFVFDAPVYIAPGELMAFVVKSTTEDYTLFYAQQNTLAVPSTAKALPTDADPTNATKIGALPQVGSLFESQNAITWTTDQSKQLMFVLDRCIFSTSSAAVPFVVPKNLPYRKMGDDDILHKLNANSVSNLYGNQSQDIFVDALNVSTTDFVPSSTSINYSYITTLASNQTKTSSQGITPGKFGTPTPESVYLDDGKGERKLIKSSANSFSLTATLATSDTNVSPIISDDGISLYTVRYLINNMGLSNSVVSVAASGNGYNVLATTVTVSAPDIEGETATAGVTANANGAITSCYIITPGSGYITTPTITISNPTTRTGNSNTSVLVYGETSPKGGNSLAKYFTKKVVLSPSSDSGDLRVYYTAYRPTGTNIFVYYKILNRNDIQNFEDGYWQLMTTLSNSNSFSLTRDNLIEFEAAPGIYADNQANNNISYVSIAGQTYSEFSQFAIKVVLSTSDKTVIPYLTNIRALAVPPGTGI